MRRLKRLHLWVGLITSILILIEAVTGLILEEPQWFAGTAEHARPAFTQGEGFNGNVASNGNHANPFFGGQNGASGNNSAAGGDQGRFNRNFQGANTGGMASFRNVIEQLHRGTIGGKDIHWLMDLAAIALIFLTLSGIYMSIRILAAEGKRKKRADV